MNRILNRMADDWRVPWRRNLFWVFLVTASLYAGIAWAGSFMTNSARVGCERGNTARKALYLNAEQRIAFDEGIYAAVREGPNSERVRVVVDEDQAQAREVLTSVTLSPGSDEPWSADCAAVYPYPLPWP